MFLPIIAIINIGPGCAIPVIQKDGLPVKEDPAE